MKVCYDKLFKLLKKRKIKETELAAAIGISSATLAKLSRDEPVSLAVLLKICEELSVDFGDIMEADADEE